MNVNYAIAIVTTAVGLFSSAVYAQSTTYSDIPKAFGVASAGPVAQPNSVSSGFETSWLHLRESHGVGLPAPKSGENMVVAGSHCDTRPAGVYENSWLNLRETHGVGVKPGEGFAASVSAESKC